MPIKDLINKESVWNENYKSRESVMSEYPKLFISYCHQNVEYENKILDFEKTFAIWGNW